MPWHLNWFHVLFHVVFCFFRLFLIRLNAFLLCKIVKNPQKYTIYITWLYVKCQLTEKLKKTIDSVLVCALLLCSLRFHEKSKNESVHSWRPFVKRHALALLLRFSLWFFFRRLPLFSYIAFICCAFSVLFHKAYQNGNGIFLVSLFFSCWQATQQNPTHYTAPRVIKYMAQQ